MIEQLLIAKRIFWIGESYAKQTEPLSAGLAISLFQDSVEQLTWCIAKHKNLGVKDTETFTSLLDKVDRSSEETLPHKAKMLELNKARVGFKHYGNLPASSESEKFRSYTYDFLVVASQRYLGVDFEQVSLASLITDSAIRNHVEAAESNLAAEQVSEAVSEVALARFFLFKKLSQYLPKVDHRLSDADRVFQQIPELRGAGVQVFRYLTQYLDEVARFNAAALAGGSVGEHLYFERALPHVTQFSAGNTRVRYSSEASPQTDEAWIFCAVHTKLDSFVKILVAQGTLATTKPARNSRKEQSSMSLRQQSGWRRLRGDAQQAAKPERILRRRGTVLFLR